VDTGGSTYRKPGAVMLIASNGESAGLLSGGCLEGDLGEYARVVIDTGKPRLVTYDMRGGDDLIWGLGLGCEGAMHILLIRVGPDNDWQPMSQFSRCLAAHRRCGVGIVVESERAAWPVGATILEGAAAHPGATSGRGAQVLAGVAAALDEASRTGRTGWFESAAPRLRVFALSLSLPPRLLLL